MTRLHPVLQCSSSRKKGPTHDPESSPIPPGRRCSHAARLRRRRLWRRRHRRRPAAPARPAPTSQGRSPRARRAASSPSSAASDVDYLDPGHTYYTFGFQVIYAMQPAALLASSPTTATRPMPDLAEGEPEISDGQEDGHGQDHARASSSRPPVNREVTAEGRQVRHRALLLDQRRRSVPRLLQRRSRARRRSRRKGVKTISGITTPDDQHDRLQAQASRSPSSFAAALVMPITVAGARGVRARSSTPRTRRRTTRTSSRPART